MVVGKSPDTQEQNKPVITCGSSCPFSYTYTDNQGNPAAAVCKLKKPPQEIPSTHGECLHGLTSEPKGSDLAGE